MGERQNYARTIVARALLPCRQICVADRADARESIVHPIMSDAPNKLRTRSFAAALFAVRSLLGASLMIGWTMDSRASARSATHIWRQGSKARATIVLA
ncbi:hypothetical protein A3748_06410 [Erythrobacter sp. HI0077]|nr:hypothetical protein A3748_06410 [Erythrobacter sp. HI0077]